MRIPIVTILGTLDVEIRFMPADPDSGFPEPYVDEIFMYYADTNTRITREEEEQFSPSDLTLIERTYIKELTEQSAIAQAYGRGAEKLHTRHLLEQQEHKYDG